MKIMTVTLPVEKKTDIPPVKNRVDDFLIHTMPKRFINVKFQERVSHKGAGLLILGIGGIILILGVLFVYFYVIKPGFSQDKSEVVVKTVAPLGNEAENAKNKAESATTSNSSSLQQSETAVQASPSAGNATATSTGSAVTATGSQEIATTTTEIIADDSAKANGVIVADSDSDGLNDVEEVFLGTDKASADSDGDGYGDLSELLSLYNPTGKGDLKDDLKIKKYFNRTNAYSLYYPNALNLSEVPDSAIFKIDDLQFIQVIVSENSKSQSLQDWYKEQSQASEIQDSQKIEKKGWEGIKSREGMIVYLLNPLSKDIYTINYNSGDNGAYAYKEIFQMMVNSLELGQ